MVPLFFAFAVQTMRMTVGDARQRCALFPGSKLFASVEQKRAGHCCGQAVSLEQFMEAVLRRVTSEVAEVAGGGPTPRICTGRMRSTHVGRISGWMDAHLVLQPILQGGSQAMDECSAWHTQRRWTSRQGPEASPRNGPIQAGVTGAPKLENFQRRLAQAPAKP
jgi:hypothetical protein